MKDKKTFLKKWMNGTLDVREEKQLLEDVAVDRRMRSLWNEIESAESQEVSVGKRIWKKIENRIDRRADTRWLRLYKTIAVAASLLLMIGTAGWMYQEKNRPSFATYVVTSGIRCIEPVSLPDGTEVRMGPNSRLTYPQSFEGNTREVELTGQAFFKVAENRKKPFIVRTEHMDVTALGTAFEVFNYPYENRLETILLEGKVKVDIEGRDSGKRREVILTPDEMLSYTKQNHQIRVQSVDAGVYSGWRKEGVLTFENERLSRILSRLEPWFGQKIACPEALAEKYRFTFKVRDESLERILFILRNASPIRYRETDTGYELYMEKNE